LSDRIEEEGELQMNPIPEVIDPDIYAERDFIDSGFIKIESNELIDVCMQYPILGMENAENDSYVRKEVFDILMKAAQELPKGYRFRILDAWRSFALQQELYDDYSRDIIVQFGLNGKSEEEKKEFIKKFVSEPVADSGLPPVHTTGGAVDITILDPDGCELDMGSGFDEFSHRTYTAFYENSDEEIIKSNRRLLYSIMTDAGFTNLPSEWWHYDYGDRFWAYYMKKPAIYRGIFTKDDIIISV
jgi:D-alanyl-D-alanine dipeptidase